jgi:hypothetical protein
VLRRRWSTIGSGSVQTRVIQLLGVLQVTIILQTLVFQHVVLVKLLLILQVGIHAMIVRVVLLLSLSSVELSC